MLGQGSSVPGLRSCSDPALPCPAGSCGAHGRGAALDLWRGVCLSQRGAVLPLQRSLGPAFGHQDLGADQVSAGPSRLDHSFAQEIWISEITGVQWLFGVGLMRKSKFDSWSCAVISQLCLKYRDACAQRGGENTSRKKWE